MTRKLYVGNLDYSIDSDELVEIFSAHGDVCAANVVSDRATGRSRGFGFVEMTTAEQATTAMSGLDGSEIRGRSLRVSPARERQSAIPPRDQSRARLRLPFKLISRQPHNDRGD